MSTIVRKRSLSAAPSTSSPDWLYELQKMQSPLSALPVFSDFPFDVSEGEDDDSTVGEERPLLSLEPPASFCTSSSSITDRTGSITSTASEKEFTTPPPPPLVSPSNAAALNYSLENTKFDAEFAVNDNRNDGFTAERGRSIRRERERGSGVQHRAERIPIRPKPHNQVNNHSRSYQHKSNPTSFPPPQPDLQIPLQSPHPGVGYIRGIGTPPPVANPAAGGVCPPSMGLMPPFGLLAFTPWQIFTPFGLPFVTTSLPPAANTVDVNQKCVGPTQPSIASYQNIISCQQPNNNIINSSVNSVQSYPLRCSTNTAFQGRGVSGAAPVMSSGTPHEFRGNRSTANGCGSPQGSCCTEPSCASTGSPLSSAIHANANESHYCNTRIRHVHPSTWRHEPYPVDTPLKKPDAGPLPIADDGTLLGPLRPADVDPALAADDVTAAFTGELYSDRIVILSPELPGDRQKQHKWVEISVNDPREEPRKRRYRFSGVLPCGHRVFAKRLRFRRGWTYFMCVSCGFKWGESGAR